jgi:hypothetical protein
MSDLLRNNPNAAAAGPGSNLTQLPCYPPGRTFQAGYYGSDVAFGQVCACVGVWVGVWVCVCVGGGG